jgi:hypothetical protein
MCGSPHLPSAICTMVLDFEPNIRSDYLPSRYTARDITAQL